MPFCADFDDKIARRRPDFEPNPREIEALLCTVPSLVESRVLDLGVVASRLNCKKRGEIGSELIDADLHDSPLLDKAKKFCRVGTATTGVSQNSHL